MYRKIFLREIQIIHKIIVYFMLFGFLLPINFVYIHSITWPIVYLHWKFNNDKCILTEMEYKLKNIEYNHIPKTSEDHDFPFMRKLFSELGINLNNQQIDKFIIKYLTIVWIISIIIIIIHHRKNNFMKIYNN